VSGDRKKLEDKLEKIKKDFIETIRNLEKEVDNLKV